MSVRRSSVLTVVLAVALAATAIPAVEATEPVPLLPDLGMAPLQDFKIERKGGDTVWLRFSTIVVNVGAGPFEVYGYRTGTEPDDERHDVRQRIFNDDGTFVDERTPAWLFWARDGHSHWHVHGLQTWELAYANAPADVLRTGKKTGFCFWDNYRYGSTANAHYHPNTTSACLTRSDDVVPMGLSIGWGDNYPATLTDQYIDISGLPWGDYVLTVTADPAGEFREKDDTNNLVRALIRTRPSGVEVLSQEGYVQPIGSTSDSPPSVSLTSPHDGTTVAGGITVSADAFDDRGVAQVEFFVDGVSIGADADGSDGWTAAWDTTLGADGSHVVSATATDTGGQTASDAVSVTVDNDGGGTSSGVHVGDLDGSSAGQANLWTATVTITIHDETHTAVEGAVVSVGWSTGATASCTTGAGGTCSVSLSGIPRRTAGVTLTVASVTFSGATYDATANHDPDADSDGTSIVVSKP